MTHRIIEIDGTTFRTQGDANPDLDPWTFELTAATQTRVTSSLPYVGYLFIALGDRSTRMVVIGVPAAIIALASLAELLQALRRKPSAVSSTVHRRRPRPARGRHPLLQTRRGRFLRPWPCTVCCSSWSRRSSERSRPAGVQFSTAAYTATSAFPSPSPRRTTGPRRPSR